MYSTYKLYKVFTLTILTIISKGSSLLQIYCVRCCKNFKTSWELLRVLFNLVLNNRHYLLSTVTFSNQQGVQNRLRESDIVLWYVSTFSKKNTSRRRPTYRIHCRNSEPASMLLLGKIQKRNHCRLLIVGWIVR